MQSRTASWHHVTNVDDVPSPALLVFPNRVEENIRRMIRMTGGPQRLRPHMKTHKLPEVIRMQMAQGITKFKCATIAEAEMTAGCGAPDVLLAYQPVGPNVRRLIQLVKTFPRTVFSAIADDPVVLRDLSAAATAADASLRVLLDIDCGMHRAGVAPGPKAIELYRLIASLPGLEPGGLHCYDGHITHSDPVAREKACAAAFAPVNALRQELGGTAGISPVSRASIPSANTQDPSPLLPRLVAGGTPTFPFHARNPDVECSPGTCVFWDFGYTTKLPDLDFLPAALLLSRVVSKPGPNRLCLDLGHKAVASENPPPRVHWLELPEASQVSHSEEHMVIETPRADEFPVCACLYGIPWHICPTVALHAETVVIRDGQAVARWRVLARDRVLTI